MATAVVIEDNPANMKLVALPLGKAGLHVLCAADRAATGLALARADFPDPFLLDALAL